VANQNTAPDNVIFPRDGSKSNRIDIAAEQIGTGITKLFDNERFRSKVIRTDFGNVAVHHGTWHFVENTKDEDHGNGSLAHGSVRVVVTLIDTRQDGKDQEGGKHSCHTDQEHRTTADAVN